MKHLYKNIDYTLKRSRRKTACIQIDRNGAVSVRVPNRVSIKEVEGFIDRKVDWIKRHLDAWQDRNTKRTAQKYIDGAEVLYLGKPYPLKIVTSQVSPLLLHDGIFHLSAEYSSESKARAAFLAFYRENGIHVIGPRVAHFQKMMGVAAQKIRMSNAKMRWASCSSKGNLNFAWKCLMLPTSVLDYVVVHELAHLIHMNHSKSFWSEVEKVLPHYKQAYQWLRTHGAALEA